MLENFNTSAFEYKKLSQEEMNSRGILGRLVGVIADFKNPTRNQRKYEEVLWDKTFDDPIVKEKIENKCLYGELGHPEDRLETDMTKICMCLAEQPKKSDDGKLYGVFDVIDTPNGRILKTLLDYGTTIGVSSRGEGDLTTDYLGEEIVDPSTYQFECFDAVILPAVKAARLTPVTESLHNGKTLKQALLEDINNSTDEDKEVMKDTLEALNINLSDEKEAQEWVDENEETMKESLTYCGYDIKLANSGVILSKDEFSKMFDNLEDAIEFAKSKPLNEDTSIKEDDDIEKEDEKEDADNDGDDLVVQLQETLFENADLKKCIKGLQEQLSVCYAKEKKFEGQISTYKSSVKSLQESIKKASSLEGRVKSLEKELNESKDATEEESKKVSSLTESLKQLKESHKDKIDTAKGIVDELTSKIQTLEEEIETVKRSKQISINTLKESYKNKESELNSKVAELQKDSRLKEQQLRESLERATAETTRYKDIAKKAVDKYIVEKCHALGISSEDVKSRLGKSYTFNDINRICESLSASKIAVDKLPFRPSQVTKVQVKESVEPVLKNLDNSGDTVDAQLLQMVERLTH